MSSSVKIMYSSEFSWTLNEIILKAFIIVAVSLLSVFTDDFQVYVASLFYLDPDQ